jgi:hypothetical protein
VWPIIQTGYYRHSLWRRLREKELHEQVTVYDKGACMDGLGHTELSDKVLSIVRRREECDLEELLSACSRYTWKQVFLEVDRLSRTGELSLIYKQGGAYAVRLPRAA